MDDVLAKPLLDALRNESDPDQCCAIAEHLAQIGLVGLPLILQELRASQHIDTITALLKVIGLMDEKLALDNDDKDLVTGFLDSGDLEIREAAVYAVRVALRNSDAQEVLTARLDKEPDAFIRSLIVDAIGRCVI